MLATGGQGLAAVRPNVVVIVTDDQGYGDLSCHGNPVLKTPHLDHLHGESLRFTDYHVAPTCSPTRAALMTGRWTNRTGVWHTILGRSLLRANEATLGNVFTDGGYATGFFGKWHLGDNYPYRPEDRGFAATFRHGGGGVGQTPDFWDNAYFDGTYFRNSRPEPASGFCTDVWFEAARDFMAKQAARQRPFFAVICTNAPHGPMHAPPEASAPYADQGVQTANFFGMIANIDQNVGRLRDWLAERRLAENTLLVFTTDNGTAAGAKIFNAGMRGQKGSEYDGGHRVPMMVHWPAGKLATGRDVEQLTAHVDVLPTLADLCGLKLPEGVTIDGKSWRPLLYDDAPDWPDRILITDSQRVKDPIKWRKSAVMTDRWRLINGRELFDIQRDPGQRNDVADEQPTTVMRLRTAYEQWWAEIEPTFQDDCSIYLGHPAENPTRLTSHDWITEHATPWNQGQIRNAVRGDKVTGYWNVYVARAGRYEFRLRRWPEETGAGLRAALPPGGPTPGAQAYRNRPGKGVAIAAASVKIGEQQHSAEVDAEAVEAVFRLQLPVGNARLQARFQTADGQEMGAYYVWAAYLGEAP